MDSFIYTFEVNEEILPIALLSSDSETSVSDYTDQC